MTLFCDLDGVFTNWAKRVEEIVGEPTPIDQEIPDGVWHMILAAHQSGRKLWEDLELLPDAMVLWNFIKPLNPIILTATGASHSTHIPNYFKDVSAQKRKNVTNHFGSNVLVITTKSSVEKAIYANPYSTLIDDRPICIEAFEGAGGRGILHTSAEDTIAQLREIYAPEELSGRAKLDWTL